jgi:hypothetical protein
MPDHPEHFVDNIKAGAFLSVTPRRALELARSGQIPAHPMGEGKRKQWRFKLSELDSAITKKKPGSELTSAPATGASRMADGSPLAPNRRAKDGA